MKLCIKTSLWGKKAPNTQQSKEMRPLLHKNDHETDIQVHIGEYSIHYSKLQQLEKTMNLRSFYPDKMEEAYVGLLQFFAKVMRFSLPIISLTWGAFIYKFMIFMSDLALNNWHQVIADHENKTCAELYSNTTGCNFKLSHNTGDLEVIGLTEKNECYRALYYLCSYACEPSINSITSSSSCKGITQTTLLSIVLTMMVMLLLFGSICKPSDSLILNSNHYKHKKNHIDQKKLVFFHRNKELLESARLFNSTEHTLKQLQAKVINQLKLALPFIVSDEEARDGLNAAGKSTDRLIKIIEEYSGVSVSRTF